MFLALTLAVLRRAARFLSRQGSPIPQNSFSPFPAILRAQRSLLGVLGALDTLTWKTRIVSLCHVVIKSRRRNARAASVPSCEPGIELFARVRGHVDWRE